MCTISLCVQSLHVNNIFMWTISSCVQSLHVNNLFMWTISSCVQSLHVYNPDLGSRCLYVIPFNFVSHIPNTTQDSRTLLEQASLSWQFKKPCSALCLLISTQRSSPHSTCSSLHSTCSSPHSAVCLLISTQRCMLAHLHTALFACSSPHSTCSSPHNTRSSPHSAVCLLISTQDPAHDLGKLELGKWGRAVSMAFHPDFNIIGCQPTVVIPQVWLHYV